MADVCDIHLKGAPITKSMVEEFSRGDMKQLEKAMKKKSPAEVAEMRALMDANLRVMMEDGIDYQMREVSDIIKVQDIVNKITRNDISGEMHTTYSDVIKQREKHLYGRNSVDTRARNLRNHYRNMLGHYETMFRTSENPKGMQSISDIEKGSPLEKKIYTTVRNYEHELDPATLTPEKIQSLLKDATPEQRLALSVMAYNGYTRKSLAQFGISTKYSKDFVVKRRYDNAVLEKMSGEDFANSLVDKLDIERTFGAGTSREQALLKLRNVKGEFTQRAIERMDVTANRDFTGSKGNSMSVKFIWKNSDTAYDAFNEMTVGGLRDQIEQSASAMANQAIAVSEFGYNAAKVSESVSKELIARYQTQPTTVDQWRLDKIKRAEIELTGQQHLVQGGMTNFANNFRFINAFTKLGNAVTGTVLDAVDNGRQSFYMNGEFFGGVKDYVSSFVNTVKLRTKSRDEVVEIANQLNLVFAHLSNAEGMRLASGDIATRGGRITNLIQQHGSKALNVATLLPTQTAYSNIASGLAATRQFAKLIDASKTGKLNKFQTDFLKEYGFSPDEVKALSSGFFERTANWSDTPIFTGNGIRQALMNKKPDEVAKILGVSPDKAGQAVIDLATKVESVVNDWASRGTPKPELATKTLMFKNIENETARTAIGLATQFLDTPIAQGQYMMEMAEKIYRVNDGQWGGIIRDSAIPSAAYITTGVSMYMAADAIMAAVTNRDSMIDKFTSGNAEERRSLMLNAIGRTGYVPFVFEMLETQTSGGYNKTALDSFGSPALSTLRDTLRLAQGLDGEGGIGFDDYLKRQLPTNSIPIRAINNWAGEFRDGNKLWEDRSGSFNSSGAFSL